MRPNGSFCEEPGSRGSGGDAPFYERRKGWWGILLASALVAGCAASPEQIRQAASGASSFEICTNLGRFGANDHILYEELARRGENCSQYAAAMQAAAQQRQADAARAAAAAQIIHAMTPPPVPYYPIQPTVNCYSRMYGNQVSTQCN